MDSKCDSQWKLLNDVETTTKLIKIHADKFFDLDTLVNKVHSDDDDDIEVLSDGSDSFVKLEETKNDDQQIDTMTQPVEKD